MTPADTIEQQFNLRLLQLAQTVENTIETYLADEPNIPAKLYEAISYSIKAGGKRLRPIIVIFACQASSGTQQNAMPAAAAIEMIHTYSLIHDDLPAMDDDDFRRGKPCNHKVFGEGIAILAGDSLLTLAFNILAANIPNTTLVRDLVRELSHAAGAAGMIGGQVEDLLSAKAPQTLDKVELIHQCKTAMLIGASARMGGLCAQTTADKLDKLGDFGLKLGHAFQITDDLLDITSTLEEMGKATQKDQQAGKLTYPSIVGVDKAKQQVKILIDQALHALEEFGSAAEPLRQLARMIIERRK
ncbi:MAG: polyprenyl synthetase family protein [Planctomycetes bacterium]|nr:polyprenyl synthetase family protein [Planctomycetota bacterium]